jgi:hypothetical protein
VVATRPRPGNVEECGSAGAFACWCFDARGQRALVAAGRAGSYVDDLVARMGAVGSSTPRSIGLSLDAGRD